jgi:thiamine biosynthesis lipoprotein ApbE
LLFLEEHPIGGGAYCLKGWTEIAYFGLHKALLDRYKFLLGTLCRKKFRCKNSRLRQKSPNPATFSLGRVLVLSSKQRRNSKDLATGFNKYVSKLNALSAVFPSHSAALHIFRNNSGVVWELHVLKNMFFIRVPVSNAY